jgi:hypothetical protein
VFVLFCFANLSTPVLMTSDAESDTGTAAVLDMQFEREEIYCDDDFKSGREPSQHSHDAHKILVCLFAG